MDAPHISVEPLTGANLAEAEPLWPDRAAFTGPEFATAVAAAARLLREERAQGALLRANGRPVGVGLSVFVTEAFAERYTRDPFPHVGRHLLLTAGGSDSPVLRVIDIARRNAGDGLQLVVVMTNILPGSADRLAVLGRIMQSFVETHAGYRIARILNEVFGPANIADVRAGGAFAGLAEFPEGRSLATPQSLVLTLSKAQAESQRGHLLPMFAYNAPRIAFRDSERALLRVALDGETDDSLSAQLGLSLSAVKARWSRVYHRAMSRCPELFASVTLAKNTSRRGPQIRHVILRYVRLNPSELTPYHRPSEYVAARAAGRDSDHTDG